MVPTRARWVLVTILLAAAAGAAAQIDPDAEAAARVVMQQLEAFRRDDFRTAFGFASAEIHELFDLPRFEVMVRGGYPEIARSVSAVVDGSERGAGGRLYLLVRVRGANGRSVEAVYEMVREERGWRINGVVTRPDTSETAWRERLTEGRHGSGGAPRATGVWGPYRGPQSN